MRCRWSETTLVLEGNFLAASTGLSGGIARVRSLFNRTVPSGWHDPDPQAFLTEIASKEGIRSPYFGLLTAVPMDCLVICRSDLLDLFVTAGTSGNTINIIAACREGLTRGALLESIATVSSAKTAALLSSGYTFIATPTDAVIVASEGREVHHYAGTVTPLGRSLVRCVIAGVPRAFALYEDGGGGPVTITVGE